MDCGNSDLVCQGMTLIEHNEFVVSAMAEFAARFGERASGIMGLVATFIQHNAQTIFGAGGLAFGIWRWWRYREQILHKRLAEYLRDSDARLKQGQQFVLDALERPAPGQSFSLPLFASDQLRAVLRERNWDKSATAVQVASSAEWQLSQALEKIQRQLKTADEDIASLRQQCATAHILRGAIASSLAKRNSSQATEKNNLALTEFRTALQIPGHESDVIVKELEAHQLRKLGHLAQALQAYLELEQLASTIEDQRAKILVIARAKRYRAEILQATSLQQDGNGQVSFKSCWAAHDLISSNRPRTALDLRKTLAPFRRWDLCEQGEINYVAALVCNIAGFGRLEADHLDGAETAYSGVLAELPQKRFSLNRNSTHRLRMTAKAGLERTERAREGIYDADWLTPPLKKTK